jgi:hypothetical protein
VDENLRNAVIAQKLLALFDTERMKRKEKGDKNTH